MTRFHLTWTPLLLSLAATTPLLLVYTKRDTFLGFGYWTAGSLALCAAALAHGLGTQTGSAFVLNHLVGNNLLLSYLLFFVGCRVLRGHASHLRALIGLWLLWGVADFWLSDRTGQTELAHAAEQLACTVLLGASAWALVRQRPPFFGIGDATFAAFATLVSAYHLLRLVAELPMVMSAWASVQAPDPLHDAIALSGFKAVGFALSQLMVLFDRKAWEADQAARERREVERLKTFESFFHLAPVPLVFTTRWTITSVNEAFRRLFRLPLSGPLDTEEFWYQIVPDPQERQAVRSALDGQLLQLKNPGDTMPPTEFRLRGPDNHTMYLLVAGRQLHSGVLVSLHDIGPQRQLQEQLRDSEERYRHAMSASRDGIWDWDLVRDHIDFSPSYLDMLGRKTGESFNNGLATFVDLLHPDDRDPTLAFLRRCLPKLDSFELEFRLRHQQGHHIWVLSRGRVVERDTAGAPMRAVGTHTDITERKSLEFHLKSALEQQRALLQAAPLGICAIEQGRLVQCNTRMYTLFADLPFMVNGCSLYDLIPQEALQALESTPPATETGEQAPRVLCTERAVRHPDGQTRWLRFHGHSISGRGLWHDGIMVIEDITEARRMTEQLVRSRDAADSAVRATLGLLANLRHEVNTPLNAILGFAELLDMPDHGDIRREAPGHIRQAALKLQGLLRQLHDLAAAYAQPINVRQQALDLPSLCEQSLAAHRDTARRKALVLQAVCNAPSESVYGDPDLLHKAIDQLLANALRQTEQGFVELRLHVETVQALRQLRVEVIDSGTSVADHQRDHLFKPFITADFSDTRENAGLALGLSEVQRIAQAMQGHAYYQPRQPQGNVFGFRVQISTGG